MKKLIELFNKKYGHIYGVIDDSIDNEDVYKVYKMIKSLCGNDQEIMEMLNKIKLPNPRTASESIEKINAEHVSGEGLDDLIKYVDDNLPHYNETLVFEISGEDFKYYVNNSYFNIDALNLDETKSYVGKNKFDINSDEEYDYKFVYDKETDALINEISETYIYNHKSYNGTNFVENENSAVLTHYITPMFQQFNGEGYFRLYEVDKLKLDNKCLSDNVSIVNSLTVGNRIGDIGGYSTAEGENNTASGQASHAEGIGSTANGGYSHAEANGTIASGLYSHAEGGETTASGGGSHAEGRGTKASSDYQHVQGKYNIEDTRNKYAHIVGNGEYDYSTLTAVRSNAHTLDWDGNGWYAGKLTQEGVPAEDKDLTTKKYVDDKTKILPVKNNYTIFEDAVPSSTEVASTYNIGEFEYYIFDSLQNEDMIISAVKYNLNVTFNDGTNDRTMDLIIERSLKGGVFCEKDGIAVKVGYSETNHVIEMILVNANDYTQYSILKATLNCDSYSNLLQDYHIENINYDKIKEVPSALNSIANYENFTLKGKEYYELYDNLSIWDANKFNERLDENSGVKRNEFFKLLGEDKYTLQIKQKDSEGIGFGQHISIDNSKNVHIVADAGVDVIIKIYNSTTKELIDTLNYCEAGFYKTRIINKDYLNGVTSIFIAFTVKDSTESFYGNTQVNDLIVHYDSSFLVKEEILTKTNTKEYIPTGDYNPATKKYVDEKIASIDTTIDNTLPVNGSLNLTTSKFQTTTLASDVEVILPTVEGYTEIHLFFLGISGTNILDTNVAWNNKPTIEDNKKYEFIYTYVNSEIGWLGKAVVYTV